MKPPIPAPVAEWHNDTYASISPTRPELSAKGKRIVVTGGGAGIGVEIVRSFAIAGAARIAILGRRQKLLEATKAKIEKEFGGVNISTHAADVSKEADLVKAAKEIGTWDVLVMNAGYLSTPTRVVEVDMEDWWKGFEVSSYLSGQFKAPLLILSQYRSTSKAQHLRCAPSFALKAQSPSSSAPRPWQSRFRALRYRDTLLI